MLWLENIREKDTIAAPPSAPRLLAGRKKHLPGPCAAVDVHLKCHGCWEHGGSVSVGLGLCSALSFVPRAVMELLQECSQSRVGRNGAPRPESWHWGLSCPPLPTASSPICHGGGGHSEVAPWGWQEGGPAIALLSHCGVMSVGCSQFLCMGLGCAQWLRDLVAPRDTTSPLRWR